jgi:hypothetical protein
VKLSCENCKRWLAPGPITIHYGICLAVPPLDSGPNAVFRTDEDGDEYIRSDAPPAALCSDGDASLRTTAAFCCIMHEPKP